MRLAVVVVAWAALIISGRAALATPQPSPRALQLSCSAFPPTTTEADLRTKFGSENVTNGLVPDPNGAEGDRTEGTVLFAKDEDALLEISWKDAAEKRRPSVISRMAAHGRWRTPSGISLGTDLKTVEKLNGRPFSLLGMGFDQQGCVTSLRGGRLEAEDSEDCRVGMCLQVESSARAADAALARQVTGDHIFSSGHPAMQALNPTVYWIVLDYRRKPAFSLSNRIAATRRPR
jgi:hypothetical protein